MRMPSRWWGWGLAVPLVLMGTGCTSVRMVQREGCWIKQTERWIVGTKEEMGPCARPAQALSQDPVIRAVQECVAQADYRWQARAMEAWRHGEQLPESEGDDEDGVLEGCLSGPLREALSENTALRSELERVLEDRTMLRTQTDEDRRFLQASHERIATSLGEAANKPPGTATATAHSTSEGTAHVQGDLRASSEQSSRSAKGVKDPDPRAPAERGAPLELMRSSPGERGREVDLPVDAARPAAPGRHLQANGTDEADPIDLWERLEDREGEAVQATLATDERDATGGSGVSVDASPAPIPARAAVRSEADVSPKPAVKREPTGVERPTSSGAKSTLPKAEGRAVEGAQSPAKDTGEAGQGGSGAAPGPAEDDGGCPIDS